MVKTGMKQNNILLTGFKQTRFDKSSSKVFLEQIRPHDKHLFSNNYDQINKEVKLLQLENYDYVYMFGQKPIIKRLTIEIDAKKDNTLSTNYPIDYLIKALTSNNISYRLSHNPGNSYCNHAYYKVLEFIKENNLKTKVIFIHIPYIKNFVEVDKCINYFSSGGVYARDSRS